MIPDAEQRVDSMIAEGLRIMEQAVEEYRPVQIVAAYSSGDDSIVTTHFTMTNVLDAFVFNADTRTGLTPSREHLVRVCQRFGWSLEVFRADPIGPPKTVTLFGRKRPFDARLLPAGKWTDGECAYDEYCLNFGMPGPGMHPRMYQRLKERPIRRMLKNFNASNAEGKPKVLIVSGIRQDESSIRAGYRRASAPGYFGAVWVNPFYFRSKVDFEAYRQEFSLPRNPCKLRCGISGECTCGTFTPNNIDERAAYAQLDPDREGHICFLEQRCKSLGLPCEWGARPDPKFVAANQIVKDAKRGQGFLFEADERLSVFQPMCVGCNSGRR